MFTVNHLDSDGRVYVFTNSSLMNVDHSVPHVANEIEEEKAASELS